MLTSIKTYLMAGFIVMMLSLIGYSYKLHGDVQRLELEVAMYMVAAQANEKALEQSKDSCEVSIESLAEHYRKEIALTASQEATQKALDALPTLTLKENAHAAPTKSEKPSDDDRLSPELMQLLDNAYCDGDKDGCASPTK